MSNYGFFPWSELDKSAELSISLLDPRTEWSTTGEYKEKAKNHCASTLVLNLFVLDSARENVHLSKEERNHLFERVHREIGNGPVAFLARKIKRLFVREKDKLLKTSWLINMAELEESLQQNRPVALLLRLGLLDWHWVLATGIVVVGEGEGKRKVLQIIDNWHPKPTYYRMNEKSKVWSMTSYHLPS